MVMKISRQNFEQEARFQVKSMAQSEISVGEQNFKWGAGLQVDSKAPSEITFGEQESKWRTRLHVGTKAPSGNQERYLKFGRKFKVGSKTSSSK